jgi:hypothetical protein
MATMAIYRVTAPAGKSIPSEGMACMHTFSFEEGGVIFVCHCCFSLGSLSILFQILRATLMTRMYQVPQKV